MIRLRNERLDSYLADKSYLKNLRHNWEQVSFLSKFFRPELTERNIVLAEEVLKASVAPTPEIWDHEDEQKSQSLAVSMRKNQEKTEKYTVLTARDWDQEWAHIDEKASLVRRSRYDSGMILPPNLVSLVLDYRGPTPPAPSPILEPLPTDPWVLPQIEISA